MGIAQFSNHLPYGFSRAFHVMAKPIGSICNLDCSYCYYLHKEHLLPDGQRSPMQEDLLDLFIKQYIESQDVDLVRFSWHGGEPTLLGLDFFRKVVGLQQRYANGKAILNDVQTNGTLLNQEWCAFFAQNRFVLGLSIDGPKMFHDKYRLSKSGQPTFDQVIQAFHLLQRFGIQFNTLTVVNRLNAKYPEDIYNFLARELGSRHIQFLPCVEAKSFCSVAPQCWDPAQLPVLGSPGAQPGNMGSLVTEWSVDPNDWGDFLCRVFDVWVARDLGTVHVSWFDSLIAQLKGRPALMCVLADVCGRAVAMERDGSVYSCDHYVYPEYKIGNVREKSLSDMVYSGMQRRFGCNKRDTLPAYCRACEFRSLCNGECPKNRLIKTPDGEAGLNYLCAGFKRYFAHAAPKLRELVAYVEYEQPQVSPRTRSVVGG